MKVIAKTPIALYRQGNADSPRLDNVRPNKDVRNGVLMILSFKDVQFIIEAIELQIKIYQERLQDEELNEDLASDIGNDCYFLEALHKDLIRAIKEGNLPKLAEPSENLYQEARN